MNLSTICYRKLLIPALLFVVLGMVSFSHLEGASKRYDDDEETRTSLREMRDTVDEVKHEVSNHETEIRMFDEKLNNQGTTLDALSQQILDATQVNKELVKNTTANLETKINGLETINKGLVADFKQLKTHANDSSSSMEKYEQRIARLEKIIEVQNKNISNLESALSSLANALELKDSIPNKSQVDTSSSSSSSSKTYRVKSGDSLEKIARHQGTTIKAIKELNKITNDKIIVGQQLELP